jgi:uncharacterized membrane protein
MSKSTPRPLGYVVGSWVLSFFSLGLLYVAAVAVRSDIGQFRSCNANNAGLVIHACGKGSINTGDVILIGLFILSACLVVSLFTHSWRLVKRTKA